MLKVVLKKWKDSRANEYYKRYWQRRLTDDVLDMLHVDGMDPQEEIGFKMAVLLYGRTCIFRAPDGTIKNSWYTTGGKIGFYPTYYDALVTNPTMASIPVMELYKDAWPVYCFDTDAIMYDYMGGGGYSDLIEVTAEKLAYNDVSTEQTQFLKRLPTAFTARNDVEYNGFLELLNRIKRGVHAVIVKTPLPNSVTRLDGGQGIAPLSEFTEYQQYVLGQFYAAIGIDAPWNIKRAQVSAAETNQNTDLSRYNIAPVRDRIERQLQAANAALGTDYHVIVTVDEVDKEQQESEVTHDASADDVGETVRETGSSV